MDTDPHPPYKRVLIFGREFSVRSEVPEVAFVRLIAQIDFESNAETGCWRWKGSKKSRGYGVFFYGDKYASAHKASWTMFFGPVAEGLQLHHRVEEPIRCMGPSCINPAHLLPLDHRTHVLEYTPSNVTVGNRERTHCIRGHELSGSNLYVYPGTTKRRCMACHRQWQMDKYRAQLRADPPKPKTHCSNGHELTPDNVYTYLGFSNCKRCHYINSAKYYKQKVAPLRVPKLPRTHCKNGHPWVAENHYSTVSRGHPRVVCIICQRDNAQRAYAARRTNFPKKQKD